MIPAIYRSPRFYCWGQGDEDKESQTGGMGGFGGFGGLGIGNPGSYGGQQSVGAPGFGGGYSGSEGGYWGGGAPLGWHGPALNPNPYESMDYAIDTSGLTNKTPEQAGKDYNDLIGQIAAGYGKKGLLAGLATGNFGLAAIAGLLGMAYGYSTTPGFTDVSGKTGASMGPTGQAANDSGIEGLGGEQIASLVGNQQLMQDLKNAGYGDLVDHIDALNQQQELDNFYADPRYGSYKMATERQYDLARKNLFSTLPSGGVLQGALSDLELSKAGTLSDYIAAMQQDIADKQHQVELAKLGGNIQLTSQNAWINAQEKARQEQQQQQMYQSIGYILSDWFGE